MDARVEGVGGMAGFARRLVAALSLRAGRATVLALSGELGAGKTTLAQEVAKALGVEERVTSPTFVIENVYALQGQKWARLIHIDAYRLENAVELEALGWHELLADPSNLIVLEWPERVASAVPNDATRLSLQGSGDTRRITGSDVNILAEGAQG